MAYTFAPVVQIKCYPKINSIIKRTSYVIATQFDFSLTKHHVLLRNNIFCLRINVPTIRNCMLMER